MLYLVATPIGNLGDISARALETLRSASVIAAEDTRVTRKLLSHYDIKVQLISYHEHSGQAATEALVRCMTELGQSVALVTDAGTPGISDPGVDLVAAAIAAGVFVVPIPGPAAFVAALVASGLPPARFVFEGFLPRTRSTRLQRLEALKSEQRTLIFYEAPQRVGATLAEMAQVFSSERQACLAREITKKFEEFQRGTLNDLAALYASDAPRGECVIVIGGAGEATPEHMPPDMEDEDDRGGVLASDTPELRGKALIRQLAAEIGIPRRDLYQLVAKLKNEGR